MGVKFRCDAGPKREKACKTRVFRGLSLADQTLSPSANKAHAARIVVAKSFFIISRHSASRGYTSI